MKKLKCKVGDKFITNEGYNIIIVEIFNYNNCTIKFIDTDLILKNRSFKLIQRGSIKNPYHRSVYGTGYVGEGSYKVSISGKMTKSNMVWRGMIERCYNSNTHILQPTYKNCTVVEEWHNYQNFAKWFEENYIEGFELDKDILIKGNKVYGPDTCCFVPSSINSLFTKANAKRGECCIGVWKNGKQYRSGICTDNKYICLGSFSTEDEAFLYYKIKKENYIKEIANKFKDKINIKTYNALLSYSVEMND